MTVTCQVCGEELASEDELARHDHELPTPWRDGGASFECPTCGIGFDQEEDLVAHMAVH